MTQSDMELAGRLVPDLTPLREAPSAMTTAERLALFAHIFAERPANYLEIGSLRGGSALIVVHAMNASLNSVGRLTIVDPCLACEIDAGVWSRISNRTRHIREASPGALLAVETQFDTILIDGDHSEAATLADLEAAWLVLAPDGSLLIHDVCNYKVRSAVERFIASHADASDCGMASHQPHEEQGELWGGLQLIRKVRPVGVAIITLNRLEALRGCVEAVRRFTSTPHHLVVADDGSTDGTKEYLRNEQIVGVGGVRRGLGWNRNRAMHYFMERMRECTTLLILEDDCRPNRQRWEREWIAAAQRWSYVCYVPEHLRSHPACGTGTPCDPWFTSWAGTQCLAVTRNGIDAVGYSDTRFHPPYGHEDTDLRWRYARHMGCLKLGDCTPTMASGVVVHDYGTHFDAESERLNRAVLEDVRNEPPHRPAWRNEDERRILTQEIWEAR